MNKKGELYKSMNKGRIKLLVYGLIMLILSAYLTVNYFPYVKTYFVGATPLDFDRFLSESKDISITNEYTADEKEFDYYINDYTTKDTSYWQDNSYLFSIPPTLKEKDIIVYKEYFQFGDETKAYESLCIHLIEKNGRNIAVIADSNTDLEAEATIKGVLTIPGKMILADLAKKLDDDEIITINEYVIDTRDIEMGMEELVLMLLPIFLIIGLFLIIKGIIYFINPKLSPTFRQLKKYGEINDIICDIENQVQNENSVREKKTIYTDDWVLIQSSFKKKVEKNPAKGHQFKYTNNG